MSLDTHIEVTLTVNNSGVTQQGFGTVGMVTYKTLPGNARSKAYSQKSEAVADGYSVTSPEYRFLNAVLSSPTRPKLAKLLRGTRPPTIRYTVLATPVNAAPYLLSVDGEGFAATDALVTSDSTATIAEIHSGLLTQLNAVASKNYLAAFPLVAFADFPFTVPTPGNGQLHAVAHGRTTGQGPVRVSNAGGGLPVGLPALTDLWFIRVDADNVQVADSLAHALAGTALTITTSGTGVQTVNHQAGTADPNVAFTVTASAPGNFFTLAVDGSAVLSVVMDHADPGIATDLTEIQIADSDWYYLYSGWVNSDAMVKSAASFVEGTPFKFYVPDVSESASENTASGNSDTLDDLPAFNYTRTMPTYHRKPAEMWGAGLLGRVSPLGVGLWTIAYKTVAGATADKFSTQQLLNLDARRATYYKAEAGRSIAWEGKVGSQSYGFADVTVSLDFVLDLIQKRGFGLLVALDKLAYTDEDIAMMAGVMKGALDECAGDAHKIVAKGTPGDPNDPQPSVKFPKVRDIDPSVRALRRVPDGEIFFRLQAAVHSAAVALTVTF
jgi:hypothetical protein